MSGWLGAMNYGVIVANEVDAQLMNDSTVRQTAVVVLIALIRNQAKDTKNTKDPISCSPL